MIPLTHADNCPARGHDACVCMVAALDALTEAATVPVYVGLVMGT